MLLLAAGTDPQRFGELADRYAAWMQQYFDALAEADVPVVMIHDDIVWTVRRRSSARPGTGEYVFPNYRKYFAPLLRQRQEDHVLLRRQLHRVHRRHRRRRRARLRLRAADQPGVRWSRSTARRTSSSATPTRASCSPARKPEIRAEVERCMALGRDCPGFFLAVGNHIPPNTPVENALYYNQVYEELCRRMMIGIIAPLEGAENKPKQRLTKRPGNRLKTV